MALILISFFIHSLSFNFERDGESEGRDEEAGGGGRDEETGGGG